MATIEGEWDCVTDTPMGRQESVLTLTCDGAGGFTGMNAGALGSLAVYDGRIEGDAIRWKMDLKVPMPMTLDAHATLSGDSMAGEVKLGAFGTAPLKATRKA